MYYIYDEKGFKGDFGSTFTIGEFESVAEEFSLLALLNFMTEGFSLDIEAVKRDLTAIDFQFNGLEDIKTEVLSVLDKCEGMIILSNGGENPL